MQTVSGLAPVENGLLYYEVAGSGDTVVLVGGFAFDTRMWDPQFEALADRWQTVRYDLRGFGRSPPPTGPYTHHEDLKQLLTTLAAHRANVVGFSLGGMVAVRFAITYPTALERLVLIDPAVGGFTYSSDVQMWMDETWAAGRSSGADAARAAWRAGAMWQTAYERPSVALLLDRMFDDYSG